MPSGIVISRFRLSKIVVAVVLIVAGAAWGTSAGRPVVTRAEAVVEHAFVAALLPPWVMPTPADARGREVPAPNPLIRESRSR